MVVINLTTYEDCRLKRLEENKKRMEALNLTKLAQAIRASPSPKPSPMKRVKPSPGEKQLVVVRRSSRLANTFAPVYKEVSLERLHIPRSISRARDLSNRVYASEEARVCAIERAEKLQSELGSEYPNFIKSMLQSHVSGGFWLGLPSHFCKSSLPKTDEVMTLVDEEGDEFPTIYLARKSGLSGGWKGFSVAHGLVDGDALIFQLVARTKFKVYIMRGSSNEEGCKS